MFSHIKKTAIAAAGGLATAGMLVAAPASADPQVVEFGQEQEIQSPGGAIDYTVENLQPSGHNDGIWYSEVTARAVSGSPTPNIADFNARAVNSSTFAVMKGNEVDGLPNAPIAPGSEASGRIYFDVKNGTAPDSVVYRDAAGVEKVVWKQDHQAQGHHAQDQQAQDQQAQNEQAQNEQAQDHQAQDQQAVTG